MKLGANGVNEHGVQMCACKPYGRIHAWEPGEWCGDLVLPPTATSAATSSPSKSKAPKSSTKGQG